MSSTVFLVGAGPGAPDLLTVRAARLLERADIVFYDALVHPDTLALAASARKVAVGKRCGKHSSVQRFINKRLIDAARRYEIVVRLKGGDPMLFARSQEEIDALQSAGVAVEIVPGVTAALAAAAQLQTSLTRRGVSRNVVIATARIGTNEVGCDWSAATLNADTVAIYMGAQQAATISAQLIARGRSPRTPVAVCESVSLPAFQRLSGTLAQLPALCSQLGAGPVLILLGEVFRDRHAQTMPVTDLPARPRSQAQ
jgi:uroporphyrin-III C-methyltransferase